MINSLLTTVIGIFIISVLCVLAVMISGRMKRKKEKALQDQENLVRQQEQNNNAEILAYHNQLNEKDKKIHQLIDALGERASEYLVKDLENPNINKEIDGLTYVDTLQQRRQDIMGQIDIFLLQHDKQDKTMSDIFFEQLLSDARFAEQGFESCGWMIDLLIDSDFKNLDVYSQVKEYQYHFIMDRAREQNPSLSVDDTIRIYLSALNHLPQKHLAVNIVETLIVLQSVKSKTSAKLFQQYERLAKHLSYPPPPHIATLAKRIEYPLLRNVSFSVNKLALENLDNFFEPFRIDGATLIVMMEKQIKYEHNQNQKILSQILTKFDTVKNYAHSGYRLSDSVDEIFKDVDLLTLYYNHDVALFEKTMTHAINHYFKPFQQFSKDIAPFKYSLSDVSKFDNNMDRFKKDLLEMSKSDLTIKDVLKANYINEY